MRLPWNKCANRLPVNRALITTFLLRSIDIRSFDLQLNLSHKLDDDIFDILPIYINDCSGITIWQRIHNTVRNRLCHVILMCLSTFESGKRFYHRGQRNYSLLIRCRRRRNIHRCRLEPLCPAYANNGIITSCRRVAAMICPRPGLQMVTRYTLCMHMDRSPLLYVYVGLPVQPTKAAW